MAAYKAAMSELWSALGLDVILCPCAPAAGVPHDFEIWWGYTSLWNILDYPSVIIPVKSFKIDPVRDAKPEGYTPLDNPFDKNNWNICESVFSFKQR